MFDTYDFDKRIIPYWEHFGLTEKDFYCRECGKFMLDIDSIGGMRLNKNGDFNTERYSNLEMVDFIPNQNITDGWLPVERFPVRHISDICVGTVSSNILEK